MVPATDRIPSTIRANFVTNSIIFVPNGIIDAMSSSNPFVAVSFSVATFLLLLLFLLLVVGHCCSYFLLSLLFLFLLLLPMVPLL
jgi:hypothetical protein